MRKEFIEYLESIGIAKAIVERIETIYTFYRELCTDEITDVFVTDYVKGDGEREYENLLFFSGKSVMEAKSFIIMDDFDITPIKKHLNYLRITKQDYDFKKPTEKSRLFIQSVFDTGISEDLKASKENCDHLKKIILKYFVSNLQD